MSSIAELKKEWMKDPKVSEAFEKMEPEFEVAHASIAAQVEAGLTQEEIAKRMGTS